MRILPTAIVAGLAIAASPALGRQTTKPAAPPATTEPPTTAPAKDLPAAKMIIDRAIEALGGTGAVEHVRDLKYVVTATSSASETKMNLRTAGPRKLLVTAETPGGPVEMGRLDKIAWTNTGAGYVLVPEERIGQVSQLDLYGLLLTIGRDTAGYTTVDRLPFNDTDCYKVRLADEPGGKTFGYFDAGSGSLVGIDQTQLMPMGEMSITTTLTEPKRVEMLTLFTKATMVAGGMPLATLTMSDVEINPAGGFELTIPPEIQEQLAARTATTRPAGDAAPGATTKPEGDMADTPLVRKMLEKLETMDDPAQLRMMESVIGAQLGQLKTDEERKQMEFLLGKIRDRIAALDGDN